MSTKLSVLQGAPIVSVQATDRSSTTVIYSIPIVGILLSATIYLSTGTSRRQTWSFARLEKRDGTLIQQLCSGYCDTGDASVSGYGQISVDPSLQIRFVGYSSVAATLTLVYSYSLGLTEMKVWDGKFEKASDGRGAIRAIVGTNPAAGVAITETIPTGAKWLIKSFKANLITTAGAASRGVYIEFDIVGAGAIFISTNVYLQPLSTDAIYSFAMGVLGGIETVVGAIPKISIPIPQDLILPAAATIIVTAVGLLAGDNFVAPSFTVEEWLNP